MPWASLIGETEFRKGRKKVRIPLERMRRDALEVNADGGAASRANVSITFTQSPWPQESPESRGFQLGSGHHCSPKD